MASLKKWRINRDPVGTSPRDLLLRDRGAMTKINDDIQYNRFCITATEAAARVRLNVQVFQRKCREGNGPESRGRGRMWRTSERAMDEWANRDFRNDGSPS
jgi:hypothetical protein